MGFYLSAYLTTALSAHLIVDMFCERFAETLRRRSAMSLGELRAPGSTATGSSRAQLSGSCPVGAAGAPAMPA